MAEFEANLHSMRNHLTPVRDIVVRLHSILIWKKPYHAPALAMVVTCIFMALWLVDISVISKLCFIGIIVTLLDYFLPFINAFLTLPNWDENEKKFNQICELMAQFWLDLTYFMRTFSSWKTTNTKLYYSALLTSLMLLAWIGAHVHNLLLFYIVTLFLVFYPGLAHYNMFEKFSQAAKKSTKSLFPKKPSSPFSVKNKKK